jgi:hypothetical protein
LSIEEIVTLRRDIAKLAELEEASISVVADTLRNDIAKQLSSKFTIRDLSVGAFVAKNPVSGVAVAVQIDPSFDAISKAMIQSAAARFVQVALDPGVIKRAVERSTLTPSPMPERYEVVNGKQKLDELDRPLLTSTYKWYLRLRPKPISAALFSSELHDALVHASGEPAVLVVSQYSGNIWWGDGHYAYFPDPFQQLGRESPPRGYFSIALNSDKFSQAEAGWNDPDFWASKIAHELLHNLGYWHPSYKNVKERDDNNKDMSWSFLFSYENAIFEKLKQGE